jgi:RNA recognition motif-containing protein
LANKTLYVGNLPYSITESDLTSAFSSYGGSNARIIEGRGFGFVDIDGEMLETAISDKNNSQLDGRTLTVNEAKPRENRSSGGGGGGGSTGGGYGGGKSKGPRW